MGVQKFSVRIGVFGQERDLVKDKKQRSEHGLEHVSLWNDRF
jgi:hypothetical protein